MYARTSRPTHSGATVEPGLEFREGDSFKALEHELWCILFENETGPDEHDPVRIATFVENDIKARWPDRAYFIEVHDPAGGWIQIFQPYGIPRNP